jgi:hypothetical protein
MKFNVKSLLKDKTVLYVVLFFAITNFFGYILLKNYDAVMFMVLVGLITSYFSKNMIVILLSSIILTTFLTTTSTIKEGLVEGKDEDTTTYKSGSTTNKTTTTAAPKTTTTAAPTPETTTTTTAVSDIGGAGSNKNSFSVKDGDRLKELMSKKENFNPEKAMAQLEPLMKSAEGMMGMLDKTNAIGRMEGLLTRMNDMQK